MKSDRAMKQEPEHYVFPRTHYNHHRTEFYSHHQNIVSKISPQNENIDCIEKFNPDYKKVVSNNANDTNDVTEVIITNNNNRYRITESKSGEHNKTNEENIYIEENEIQNLQRGTRNKTTKENNFKPYAFIIGDSMVKKRMAIY